MQTVSGGQLASAHVQQPQVFQQVAFRRLALRQVVLLLVRAHGAARGGGRGVRRIERVTTQVCARNLRQT
jgi:hypothetical protein